MILTRRMIRGIHLDLDRRDAGDVPELANDVGENWRNGTWEYKFMSADDGL